MGGSADKNLHGGQAITSSPANIAAIFEAP